MYDTVFYFVKIFTEMDTPYYVKNLITGFCGRQYSDNLFISNFPDLMVVSVRYAICIIVVVVVLLFYVYGKHLRSCRDGQLT